MSRLNQISTLFMNLIANDDNANIKKLWYGAHNQFNLQVAISATICNSKYLQKWWNFYLKLLSPLSSLTKLHSTDSCNNMVFTLKTSREKNVEYDGEIHDRHFNHCTHFGKTNSPHSSDLNEKMNVKTSCISNLNEVQNSFSSDLTEVQNPCSDLNEVQNPCNSDLNEAKHFTKSHFTEAAHQNEPQSSNFSECNRAEYLNAAQDFVVDTSAVDQFLRFMKKKHDNSSS